MVNKERITVLIQQFADGSINKEEYAELIGYFNSTGNEEEVKSDERNIYAAMDEVWKNTHADETYSKEEADEFYQKLIGAAEFKNTLPKRRFKIWSVYSRVAAAILIILSAGLYFYNTNTLAPASVRFAKQDIDPGSNRAILTLANGKKVELASSGTYTVKDAKLGGDEEAFNTITTPRGGQYQINLPDGSSVWLNASTSLTFPVKFSKQVRKVSLVGEAYFEIAHASLRGVARNEAKKSSLRDEIASQNRNDGETRNGGEKRTDGKVPFLVVTKDQIVEVLGTHFNIKGYVDESAIKTTLLEGSVRIFSTLDKNKIATITPGQQTTLTSSAIRVSAADTEEALAWKNGLFMFDGQDLESIMKQVARWYDIDVAFENEELKKQAFKGTISRFKRISQLLEVLESTGSVHFKMEGRRITAMK